MPRPNPSLTIDRERGLPSNQVHRLAMDACGRLWMAGPSGMGCYDGSRVRCFDRRHGLECAGLRAVAVGEDQTVWIGTDLGLEALDALQQPVDWPRRPAWPYGLVSAIVPAGQLVWVGTSQGLVLLRRERDGQALELLAHHDLGFVRTLAPCGPAAAVVGVSASLGIVMADDAGLQRLRHPDLPEPASIRQVVAIKDGALLVGGIDGVWWLGAGAHEVRRLASPPGCAEVSALAFDGERCLAAFGRTLYALSLDAGAAAPLRPLLESPSHINHLLCDAAGNVWVASDSSGVHRASCLRRGIELIDLGVSGAVYAIRPGPAGTLQIGGDGFSVDLPVRADGPLAAAPASALTSTVWDSLPAADGSGRWLATHDGLVLRDTTGRLAPVRDPDNHLGAPCRVLLQRPDGLWVGTLRGLMRWQGGVAQEVRGNDGGSLGYIYTLREDAGGRLWVGTLGRGLWREQDGELVPVQGGPLSATGNTCVVLPDPAGQRWLVLQDERIVLIEGDGTPRLLATEHPVAGWAACWIDEQRVAIGSSEGLRLLDLGSGGTGQRINALLGPSAWEFTNNRTLVPGADGRLYCGVNAGLVAVDLRVMQSFGQAPQVRLAELTWQGATPTEHGGRLRLRPGKWSLELRVFSAWLVDEGQLRYRFRLAGFETDWSALSAQPVARYSSLPPGRYKLQAQAFAPLTGYGEATAVLELEVSARGVLQALMGALTAWFDDRLGTIRRNRRLLQQHDRIEQEIGERLRALAQANQELERRRAAMEQAASTDPLTGWANRRAFEERLRAELGRATRTGVPLGLLLVDVDHFKLYNDCYGHLAGDECLRRLTREMKTHLRPYDVSARYGGEEFVILLPGADPATVETIGRRLCQELALLALPHAEAPSGVVTLSIGGLSTRGGAPAELLHMADLALYRAKAQGRNRFVTAESERAVTA